MGVRVSRNSLQWRVHRFGLPSSCDFSQQSRFLTAWRRLEKLVLHSVFDTSLSSSDDAKLAELSNNSFERKNMTFWEVKTYSDPSYIFDPQPPGSIRPCTLRKRNAIKQLGAYMLCKIFLATFMMVHYWRFRDRRTDNTRAGWNAQLPYDLWL